MDKTEQLAEMVIQAVQFYFEKKAEPILKELAAVKQNLLVKESIINGNADELQKTIDKVALLEARPIAVAVEPATIAAEVSRQIALVPPPADGKSVDLGAIFSEIGSAVTRAVDAIPPAEPGKSVTLDDVRPMIDAGIADAVAKIREPEDGEDGKSVTVEDVRPILEDLVAKRVAEIPKAKDGDHGTSVTVDDIRPMLAEMVAAIPKAEKGDKGDPGQAAVLDREDVRRDIALEVHRELSTWERPKDGLGIEDMSAELREDGRTLVLGFSNSAMHTEREILIPWQIYRGLWEAGRKYQKGDVVTYGGSQFTAKVDTDQAPKTDDWLLSVKRG